MPTIAIVGAGPGLGASIARVFGGHGFDVGLISRSKDKLDTLVAQLADAGINAAAFPADVADRPALATALDSAAAHFGGIDVLEYSPYGGLTSINPQEITVDNLQPEIEDSLYGAVTAAQAVLPRMLGDGTARCCSPPAAERSTHIRCSPPSMPRKPPYAIGSSTSTPSSPTRASWPPTLPSTSSSAEPRRLRASPTPTPTTSPRRTGSCTSDATSRNASSPADQPAGLAARASGISAKTTQWMAALPVLAPGERSSAAAAVDYHCYQTPASGHIRAVPDSDCGSVVPGGLDPKRQGRPSAARIGGG